MLRSEILADGRRISFKNYRDKLSQKYIGEYLEIVNGLPGYLFTFALDKKINSIFESAVTAEVKKIANHEFIGWSNDTIEKTFRILHIIGFVIAGFSSQLQNIIWITDNDKIAPNNKRLTQLTTLFGQVISQYLRHDLGHLRVGTTESDDGSRFIEDLCAIPDLAAGAFSDKLKTIDAYPELADYFWFYSPEYKKKTADLIWWMSTFESILNKLCFKVDLNHQQTVDVKFYHFKNRE